MWLVQVLMDVRKNKIIVLVCDEYAVQVFNNGVHQYPDHNHQVDDGELGALEDYQATDFISIFQKVKLALNLLVTFSMKN